MRHEQPDRRRGGTPWWIWLLGLVALGLVAFMIFQGANADPSTEVDAGNGNEVGTMDGAGSDEAAAATGTISSSDGVDLLDLSADSEGLAGYEETDVEGASAPVESVVGDETFWVGESPERRLFVFLNPLGESGPDIDAGDDVTFDGTVRPFRSTSSNASTFRRKKGPTSSSSRVVTSRSPGSSRADRETF